MNNLKKLIILTGPSGVGKGTVVKEILGKEKNIWLPYLNRLSDYLFVLARYISTERGSEEILWDREL